MQKVTRQHSRHASLTLCGQAAPLPCRLPELSVPRGETAGAAFLMEGVTVQARLSKLPGRLPREVALYVASVHMLSVQHS